MKRGVEKVKLRHDVVNHSIGTKEERRTKRQNFRAGAFVVLGGEKRERKERRELGRGK